MRELYELIRERDKLSDREYKFLAIIEELFDRINQFSSCDCDNHECDAEDIGDELDDTKRDIEELENTVSILEYKVEMLEVKNGC